MLILLDGDVDVRRVPTHRPEPARGRIDRGAVVVTPALDRTEHVIVQRIVLGLTFLVDEAIPDGMPLSIAVVLGILTLGGLSVW